VAALGKAAAARFGLGEAECKLVEGAGLVHDLGRVGITVSIWDAPRPLSTDTRRACAAHVQASSPSANWM
jgi:HD-GYP domain-containing protein (c-di-GMP phosphodiesterase class II)